MGGGGHGGHVPPPQPMFVPPRCHPFRILKNIGPHLSLQDTKCSSIDTPPRKSAAPQVPPEKFTLVMRHCPYYVISWHALCVAQIPKTNINPSKKVLQFKFEGWYLSCYWSMKKETGVIEKLDYSSLQWCAICRDYVIMECAVLLNIGQSQKWNVAKCIVFNTEVSISFEDAMCFE